MGMLSVHGAPWLSAYSQLVYAGMQPHSWLGHKPDRGVDVSPLAMEIILETWSHTSAMKRQHNGEDWFNMDEKKNKVRERLAVALGAITPRPVPWPSLHIMSSSEPFSVERARSSELTYSSSMYSSGSAWNAWPFVRAPGMYSSGVGRRTASTPPPQRTRLSSMASPPCRELGNFGKLRCPPR